MPSSRACDLITDRVCILQFLETMSSRGTGHTENTRNSHNDSKKSVQALSCAPFIADQRYRYEDYSQMEGGEPGTQRG